MTRLIAAFALFLMIPLSQVQAKTTNDEGAQTLKTLFQNMLTYQKVTNEAFGTLSVVYDGELQVDQKDSHYAITLPHIKIKANEKLAIAEDPTFDIGVITINAMPADKPGYWKTVGQLPNVMSLYGKDSDKKIKLHLGEQKIMSVLSEKLGYSNKINATIADVKITFEGKEENMDVSIMPEFDIGSIQYFANLDEQDNGLYSGPSHLSFNDIHFAPPGENEEFSIGEFKLGFGFDKIALPTLLEYQAKLMKHAKTFEALSENPDALENGDMQVAQDFMNMLSDMYDFDIAGFDVEYSVKDFSAVTQDGNAPVASLKSGAFGMAFKDIQSDKGSISITNSYDGLELQEVPEEHKDVYPKHMNVKIDANNIPYLMLTDIAGTTLTSIIENPEMAEMAGLGVVMRLPAVLSQAGTEVSVQNNAVGNDIYDVTLNGKVMTDLTSVVGFVANFEAVFEGLDPLLDKAKSVPGLTMMVEPLNQLKALGEGTVGPNGKAGYKFNFVSTPEGTMTINGQDAMTALQ